MARREETAVEPMLKLDVGLGGVFRGLDEQTYNLADKRYFCQAQTHLL